MTTGNDCELIHTGLLDQPVNALSSLLFVVAAMLLRHRPVLATVAIATGLGSFLYHGFDGEFGEWAHDWSLLVLILGVTYESRVKLIIIASVLVGIFLWVLPPIAEVITVAVALYATITLLSRGRFASAHAMAAGAVLGAGAVINSLSRTGQPWCDPGSIVQGHGIWHASAALALYLWGRVPDTDSAAADSAAHSV